MLIFFSYLTGQHSCPILKKNYPIGFINDCIIITENSGSLRDIGLLVTLQCDNRGMVIIYILII